MTQTEFEHTLLQARPKMMSVAMRFFRNREDAEDVVQEVCMRILERGWRSGDNTEALLIKATKNLCVSVWRRKSHSLRHPLELVDNNALPQHEGLLHRRERAIWRRLSVQHVMLRNITWIIGNHNVLR